MSISVKVVRVPGAVTEVELNDGAAVRDALDAAGASLQAGESIKVGAVPAELDTGLSDGDRVILARAAKGNAAI